MTYKNYLFALDLQGTALLPGAHLRGNHKCVNRASRAMEQEALGTGYRPPSRPPFSPRGGEHALRPRRGEHMRSSRLHTRGVSTRDARHTRATPPSEGGGIKDSRRVCAYGRRQRPRSQHPYPWGNTLPIPLGDPVGGIAPTHQDPCGAGGWYGRIARHEVGRGTRCGIEARPEVKRPHTARPKPQYAHHGAPTPPRHRTPPTAASDDLDRCGKKRAI